MARVTEAPRWRVDLPLSWPCHRVDDALVAAAPAPSSDPAASSAGGVRPHVVVALDRLHAGVTLDAAATGALRALGELADGGDAGIDELATDRSCDERIERLVRVSWFAARHRDVDVAAVLALFAPRARGERDVLQVAAVCAMDDLDRYRHDVVAVIRSVRWLRPLPA